MTVVLLQDAKPVIDLKEVGEEQSFYFVIGAHES
jgi:hypothetical protein